MSEVALRRSTDLTYEEALTKVVDALKEQGFGVLTEIDVKATLKQKLDVDFRKYKILGACNPPLAHQALSTRIDVGVMMPCNVVVYEGDSGKAEVLAIDPMQTFAAGSAELQELAKTVYEKLSNALEAL